MTRSLSGLVTAQLDGATLFPVLLAEIDSAEGPVRAWTGIGDLTWSSRVFKGTGNLGKVSALEENIDGRASGLRYELSGIPQEIVSLSLQSIRHNRVATLWLAVLDEQGRLLDDPVRLDRGYTDVPELVDDGATATIRLTTEKRSIDQRRPRVRRYTHEDQQIDDPGDRGFEYVEGLQDKQVKWGRG